MKNNLNVPGFCKRLSKYKQDQIVKILKVLNHNPHIQGVLWGGSIPLSKNKNVSRADIDLFCLVNEPEKIMTIIKKEWVKLPEVDIVLDQGKFPWTGRICSIYFKNDLDFSVDMCLISEKTAPNFFWEPRGYIIFDRVGKIRKFIKLQSKDPNFTHLPFLKVYPFSQAILTIKKIEKNLFRNHLWNALYLMNLLRSYIMQIIRLHEIKNTDFRGRVDRDIEEVFSKSLNSQFVKTVALYDKSDIAEKTRKLSLILESILKYTSLTKEEHMKNWFYKQLKHEKVKLSEYL